MFNDLSSTWSWNPTVISILLLLILGYLAALWQARSRRLRDAQEVSVRPYQIAAFFAAIVLAAALFLTPINTVARTQLFLVHMVQAVLLTTVCAPLILVGSPSVLLRPPLELPVVRTIARILTQPLVASVLFNLTFLLTHAPKIYTSLQQDGAAYDAMMLGIFLTSLLNWWPLIGSVHELRRMSYPVQIAYSFFDGQPVDIYAFILVFTTVPLYTHYAIPPQLGLSAFGDQAAGGALLLIPGLVDLGVMSPLFFRWLAQIERKARLADQRRQEELEREDDEDDEYEEDEDGASVFRNPSASSHEG